LKPTEEQRRIKATFEAGAGLLLINAGAGTGKTTTLNYITEDDGRYGLYLAFNTSNAKEAARQFNPRVECRTTHSLAFRAMDVNRRFRDKLSGALYSKKLAKALGIENAYRDILPSHFAYQAKIAVRRFQHSADEQISQRHCYDHLKDLDYFKRFHFENHTVKEKIEEHARGDHKAYHAMILDYARKLWERMSNPNDPLPMDHDTYLKLWALTKPALDYDFILLDEGQDTNPVVLDVFLNQPAQRVVVGDEFQAIYGWRGATNALKLCREQADERLTLTQSFRYGPRIADIANQILQLSLDGCDFTLRGFPERASTVGKIDCPPYTGICRTNAGLFERARHILHSDQRFSVVGGIKDICEQIESVYWLSKDDKEKVTHPAIKIYESYRDILDEVARGDLNLRRIVKFIEEEPNPCEVVTELKNAEVPPDVADVILTTAHKSKGMEWGQVVLSDDYRTSSKTDDEPLVNRALDQDEVNVLYVAATRTIDRLQLNRYLERACE
jgi:superfamily I DNA/RNA helicase